MFRNGDDRDCNLMIRSLIKEIQLKVFADLATKRHAKVGIFERIACHGHVQLRRPDSDTLSYNSKCHSWEKEWTSRHADAVGVHYSD